MVYGVWYVQYVVLLYVGKNQAWTFDEFIHLLLFYSLPPCHHLTRQGYRNVMEAEEKEETHQL